jgi:hypothetical protein
MNRPNARDREKLYAWADALESEEYPQGRNELCGKGGFCCLGVASLIGLTAPAENQPNEFVKHFAGLGICDLIDLTIANDEWRLTFEDIAEAIKDYADGKGPLRECLLDMRDEARGIDREDVCESVPMGPVYIGR